MISPKQISNCWMHFERNWSNWMKTCNSWNSRVKQYARTGGRIGSRKQRCWQNHSKPQATDCTNWPGKPQLTR